MRTSSSASPLPWVIEVAGDRQIARDLPMIAAHFFCRAASACTFVLLASSLGTSAAEQAGAVEPELLLSDLETIAARPGEPSVVSAAGLTRSEAAMLTLENTA